MKRSTNALLLLALLGWTAAPAGAAATDDEEALWTAASSGDVAAVRALIEAGVDLDATTEFGRTALSFAAHRGHAAVVRLLVERGADLDVADTIYQRPAVEWAAYHGHVEITEYLLKKRPAAAQQVMERALRRLKPEVVPVILKTGSFTAEQLANLLYEAELQPPSAERDQIVALLIAAGAKRPPPSDYVIDRRRLARYAGTYRAVEIDATTTLTPRDGLLQVLVPGLGPVPCEPLDDTTFRPLGLSGREETLTFRLTGDEATGFVYRSAGGVLEWVRVAADEPAAAAPASPPAAAAPPVRTATPPHWPEFRGPNRAGVAEGHPLPTRWDVGAGRQVLWRRAIPGRAYSSPIVWGDRLFVTTAIRDGGEQPYDPGIPGTPDEAGNNRARHTWRIYALDKRSGEILWQRDVHQGVPRSDNHVKSSQANGTPATDGRHLVAVFGSEGLFGFDLDGNLLWRRDLGELHVGWFMDPSYQWGHGSSPVIYEDRVILQVDRNRDAYVAAWDLRDGRELWRTVRDNLPSWGTPALLRDGERMELVTNGSKFVRGYDPRTGRELWRLGPMALVTVGSPVVGQGLAFVTGDWRPVPPIYAIRPGGRGDLSLPEGTSSSATIAWSNTAGTYTPTPIVYGEYLYTCNDNGVLVCYRARTGEQLYRKRIGGRAGSFSASPVAGDGKLYFAGEDGEVFVVRAGPDYELLATNPVGEPMLATPAISEGLIYLRSLSHLCAISAIPKKGAPVLQKGAR